MLFPRSNTYRQFTDLSGFWDFRLDPQNVGLEAGWGQGLDGTRPIAVPASWNDQFEDYRDYLGNAWYQTRLTFLGMGAAARLCALWLRQLRPRCG